MKPMRTLYECSHARIQGKRIYCDRGYPLASKTGEGDLDVRMLAEGKALAFKVCQLCSDFDCLGPPVPEDERGWLKIKEVTRYDRTHRQALREAVV